MSENSMLLTNRAFQELVRVLRDGKLRSGEFLSMPVLTNLLGFPLASTREAVKRGELHGYLSILPKRGVVVMEAGPEMTRNCLDMRAMFDKEGARRLILEAGSFPASDLRDAHMQVLDQARTNMTPDLPKQALKTDLMLHDALSSGLKNPLLKDAYAANRNRIAVIQNTRPFLADRIVSAMEEHLAIIEALASGDPDLTGSLIESHYRQTMRWWGVEA